MPFAKRNADGKIIAVYAKAVQEGLHEVKADDSIYKPIVVVDYYRQAFVLDYNHIRITFDSELRRGTDMDALLEPIQNTVRVLKKDFVIMEIKYNNFWLDY